MKFELFYQKEQPPFEQFLLEKMANGDGSNLKLEEAMLYSLKAGGKRLRPLLLLMVLKSFGQKVEKGYPAALAVELIHTYSLIHDDLPAMDDDDMRRGQPSNHLVFGEATAILAGDGLLTKAFDVLTEESSTDPAVLVRIVSALAKAAGHKGMVAGQQEDIDGESRSLSLEEIQSIHRKKTGALLSYSFYTGGLLSGCSLEELHLLNKISEKIGLAYQIRDDILDITSNEEELGKPVGSDEERNKSTYPSLLGLEGAKEMLKEELDESIVYVQKLEEKSKRQQNTFDSELFSTFVHSLRLGE